MINLSMDDIVKFEEFLDQSFADINEDILSKLDTAMGANGGDESMADIAKDFAYQRHAQNALMIKLRGLGADKYIEHQESQEED